MDERDSKRIGVLAAGLGLALSGSLAMAQAQFPFAGSAGNDGNQKSAEELVKITTTLDTKTIGPGEQFHVIVTFEIEPKWHIYWKNPGETGAPTQVALDLPEGFEAGEIKWPRPLWIDAADGLTFGYEKRVSLFVPVKAPQSLTGGTVSIGVSIDWLVCDKVCLMGRASRTIEARTSTNDAAAAELLSSLVAADLARVPKPADTLSDLKIDFDGSTLRITGPANGSKAWQFFPIELPGVTYGRASVRMVGEGFEMKVPVQINENNALGKAMQVAGVVGFGEKADGPSYEFTMPVAQR